MAILQIHVLPARFYATPEYREGYTAGALAADCGEEPENPYLPYDLRHLGWADASYDAWSARRSGRRRRRVYRPELLTAPAARAFAF